MPEFTRVRLVTASTARVVPTAVSGAIRGPVLEIAVVRAQVSMLRAVAPAVSLHAV
jgi:hypothetical protein